MRECNECETFKCRKINSEWPELRSTHYLSVNELRSSCSNYTPYIDIKLPILLHLMADDRKAKVATELLKRYNFRMRETNNHPYFKLVVK